MPCPYLSVKDGLKICKRMEKETIDSTVSDFDIQHYCNGNPVNCYYFRKPNKHTKEQKHEELKHQTSPSPIL